MSSRAILVSIAAQCGCIDALKCLVSAGADLNLVKVEGVPKVTFATNRSVAGGFEWYDMNFTSALT
jgi:hypothetical protein